MMGCRAWARRWGAPAVAVALGVLELALVRLAGPPGRQLEVLRQLAQVEADPLASVLALLALAAEGLAAYLLAVLGLRLLASLPGAVGRLASGATLLVTPASLRRALDLLLGGALLAQATFVPLPGRTAGATTAPVAAGPAQAALAPLPARAGATAAPVAAGPAQTTATPLPTGTAATPPPVAGWLARARPGRDRPVAPAPLPPWLAGWLPAAGGERPAGPEVADGGGSAAVGGGPGRQGAASGGRAGSEQAASGGRSARAVGGSAGRGAVPDRPRRPGRPPAPVDAAGGDRGGVVGTHTVHPGDTLWGIAAAHLPAARRSPAAIDRYWRQLYHANRAVVGPDPDLIHPGTRLHVPGYRPDHR